MVGVAVVIPAHHGAPVLERSMLSLARQDFPGAMHVVVAVNDGRRDTWDVATRLAEQVRGPHRRCDVIRAAPGRSVAFDAAERLLEGRAVRLYLDQDAELSDGAVRGIVERLSGDSGRHFAALPLRLTDTRSAFSRAYYRGWSQLPYVRFSPATMGAYAVSALGRTRWGRFPGLRSDDKFVRTRFRVEERVVVPAQWYSVRVPEGLGELVRARRRYSQGNRQLGIFSRGHDVPRYRGIGAMALRSPGASLDLFVVGLVHTLARLGRERGDIASR